MTLPASGQISIQDIANELGISATNESLDSLASKTLNDCSPSAPNPTNPDAMSEWYSYDHTTGPVITAASVFMTGSSVPAGQADNYLQISGSSVLCANEYEIYRGVTSGFTPGPSNLVATVDDTKWTNGFADSGSSGTGFGAESTLYYKIRGLSNLGDPGPYYTTITAKTGPTAPKSFGASSGNGSTNDYNVDPVWNNGTSPGIRSMEPAEWRRNINGGSWTGWTRLSAGATTFNDNIVGQGLVDSDSINYEIRYITETTVSSATHTVLLTI